METDLVKCRNGYLITITERKSLFNIVLKIPNKEAATIQAAMTKALYPIRHSIPTITSDNGTEFACHQAISDTLNVSWFFADPYKTQHRGCNENHNGLIRQYFKRDTDLNNTDQNQIAIIKNKLNNLSPIKTLILKNVALVA